MLGFLKKKKQIKKEDYIFLSSLVENLLDRYPYLENQANKDFILDKKPNPTSEEEGVYMLTLNAKIENLFYNKNLPRFFIIRNMLIWNKRTKEYESVELDIVNGMISGFKVASNYSDLDLSKIDISQLNEKHFNNSDFDSLVKIIGEVSEDIDKVLDIEQTFEIEIDKKKFYVIKDMEDGNYISIDTNGSIYGMFHDPFKIEKIFENKEAFFKALESGIFDFDSYLDGKI
ncbi:hypothetical protein DKG77_01855 [Flagellimonas aquimarina]|uniref:Uncharacterized protein n=1 Tax=Flagellimonas aquimarina TaxID=2201895 RepID=A0A316KZG6_9FLAO|nr:hypothetical protein [Allomuricauda koreensis]PWL39602.1 hypothetical protein DKG77_01855 [Allomuricauda koreensis]